MYVYETYSVSLIYVILANYIEGNKVCIMAFKKVVEAFLLGKGQVCC